MRRLSVIGLLLGIGSPLLAGPITFDLGLGDVAISGFTGPFAQVTVDLTSPTVATITFTSLTNSGNIYLLGDGGTAGVNVNAASFTLGPISGSNSGTGFTPGPYSNGGSGNEDGFGSFNQTINSFDGFTHSSDNVSFTITNTSGTWGSSSDVLAPNADGHLAAAHIFITADPADASNGAIVTGFASGDGGTPSVPEPVTLLFLGMGLVGAGVLSRKRK